MSKLITVYDDKEPLNNVITALTIDIDEVFFAYHHEIERTSFINIEKVIKKYKDIEITFLKLIDDQDQIRAILDRNPNLIVDVGAAKYLSLVLFEQAIAKDNMIVYYDDETNQIKTYRDHRILYEDVFRLKIEDIITLRGGVIKSQMHHPIKDVETGKLLVEAVDKGVNRYSCFISYVTKINSIINSRYSADGKTFKLDQDLCQKLKTDEGYRYVKDLLEIGEDYISFINKETKDIFTVSGSFLENYIYEKLSESNNFDDVIMSVVIDFSGENYKQQVRCEIDCLIVKNNHLLFTSCKSNKVETSDLNEIYVHNNMFGNALSHPVLCTLDDLNIKSPSIYAKAKELKVAIIDKTSFNEQTIAQQFLDIIENKYAYEKLPD